MGKSTRIEMNACALIVCMHRDLEYTPRISYHTSKQAERECLNFMEVHLHQTLKLRQTPSQLTPDPSAASPPAPRRSRR